MGVSDDTLRTTSGAQEARLGLQDLGSALRDRVEMVAGGRKFKVTQDRGIRLQDSLESPYGH